jgi:hypothetical protein
MDIGAAFITIAITVGSVAPVQVGLLPPSSRVAEAIAAAPEQLASPRVGDPLTLRRLSTEVVAPSRPSALVPLYASLAVLQGFDIYTTSSALQRGAAEANPVMRPVAGNHVASVLVKAAATAGSIYFTERAWKQNRKGAVILMTAINVAAAAVVAHNTQVARAR